MDPYVENEIAQAQLDYLKISAIENAGLKEELNFLKLEKELEKENRLKYIARKLVEKNMDPHEIQEVLGLDDLNGILD